MQVEKKEIKIWRKNIPYNNENPFIETENKIQANIIKKSKYLHTQTFNVTITDNDEQEVNGTSAIYTYQEVDESKFIKIFTQNIKAMYELTGSAYKIFVLLLKALQDVISKDTVFFDYDTAKEIQYNLTTTELARSTYEKAILELVEKKFLAPHKRRGMFYINPALIFNGDRVVFMQEFKKQKEEKIGIL